MNATPLYQPSRRAERVVKPLYAGTRKQSSYPLRRAKPTTDAPEFDRYRPLESLRAYLEWLWDWRRCQICSKHGPCCHRNPELDIAQAEDWLRMLEKIK